MEGVMAVIEVDNKNFEAEVLKSDVPVLVDFWAEWCNPCKMIAPIVDEIAAEKDGQLKVTKLNVDNAQELAAQYNIMSIPSLLIFKNGEVAETIVGAMSKDQLSEKINAAL
jgi:thioredoxin 1